MPKEVIKNSEDTVEKVKPEIEIGGEQSVEQVVGDAHSFIDSESEKASSKKVEGGEFDGVIGEANSEIDKLKADTKNQLKDLEGGEENIDESKEKIQEINEKFAILENKFNEIFEIYNSNYNHTKETIKQKEKELNNFNEMINTLKKYPQLDRELFFSFKTDEIEGIQKIRESIKDKVEQKDSYRVYNAVDDLEKWKGKIEDGINWDKGDFKTVNERHVDPEINEINNKLTTLYGTSAYGFPEVSDGPERDELIKRWHKLEEGLDKFEEMRQKEIS